MNKLSFALLFINCYLQAQVTCFNPNYDEPSSFSFLPIDGDVYFLGETHNISSNDLLDYSLLTYLNAKSKIKCLIKEGSYSYIYLLNEYLQTGDTIILQDLFDPSTTPIEQLEFCDKLRIYNKDLPINERIYIQSIDAEAFYKPSILVEYWKRKLGKPSNHSVRRFLTLLANFSTSKFSFFPSGKDKKRIRKLEDDLLKLYEQNQEEFEEYFKAELFHVLMIIQNNATLDRREKSLFENFIKVNYHLKEPGYMFSYGNLHAQKKGWLAGKIENSPEFNKVVTIRTLYQDSEMLWSGQSVSINTDEELSSSNKSFIWPSTCNSNWIGFNTSNYPDFSKRYDFVFIGRKQKPVVLLNVKYLQKVDN